MSRLGETVLDRIYQEKIVLSISSILGFLLVWHSVTDLFGLMPAIILPSPEKVFFTIYEKIFVAVGEEKLFGHIRVRLEPIFVGTDLDQHPPGGKVYGSATHQSRPDPGSEGQKHPLGSHRSSVHSLNCCRLAH